MEKRENLLLELKYEKELYYKFRNLWIEAETESEEETEYYNKMFYHNNKVNEIKNSLGETK